MRARRKTGLKGLAEIIFRAHLDAASDAVFLVQRRQHDDRRLAQRRVALELGQHLEAVQPGHDHVQHHQVELLAASQRQRANAARHGGDGVATAPQPAREHLPAALVVVHHHDRAFVAKGAPRRDWVREL